MSPFLVSYLGVTWLVVLALVMSFVAVGLSGAPFWYKVTRRLACLWLVMTICFFVIEVVKALQAHYL